MDESPAKRQILAALVFDPNSPRAPATGDRLDKPRHFPLDEVLPINLTAVRHNRRPPWVKDDYPFESALEITYDVPNEHPPRDHFIWIIYGSGGK
jgi:hypothetical protein